VVDDTLGDEMQVTVIATGIGSEADSLANDNADKKPLRGKIRDVTLADMESGVDYDEPTFIRQKEAVSELTDSTYRGYKGLIIDNSDLDIPTFLRRKAD